MTQLRFYQPVLKHPVIVRAPFHQDTQALHYFLKYSTWAVKFRLFPSTRTPQLSRILIICVSLILSSEDVCLRVFSVKWLSGNVSEQVMSQVCLFLEKCDVHCIMSARHQNCHPFKFNSFFLIRRVLIKVRTLTEFSWVLFSCQQLVYKSWITSPTCWSLYFGLRTYR